MGIGRCTKVGFRRVDSTEKASLLTAMGLPMKGCFIKEMHRVLGATRQEEGLNILGVGKKTKCMGLR